MINVKKERMQGRKKIHLELEAITEIIKFNHTSQAQTDCKNSGEPAPMPCERPMADVVNLEAPRACFPVYLVRAPLVQILALPELSRGLLREEEPSYLRVLGLGGCAAGAAGSQRANIGGVRRASVQSRQGRPGRWRGPGRAVLPKPCRTGPSPASLQCALAF